MFATDGTGTDGTGLGDLEQVQAGGVSEAAMAGALEARLGVIWRRAFGPKASDPNGHVLQIAVGLRRLVRFIAEVEAELGVRVPPTALMRLGTAGAVAAAIRRREWPAASPLAMLRDGAGEGTLYIVSAGSGVVLELCDLAMLIDFPGQIWALQLPGLDGEAEPLTDVAAIARHHVDGILAQGRDGPCHLLGYSFGGLVTVEMVPMLRAAGREVGLVGLLDATCYEKYWPSAEWYRVSLRRLRKRAAELRAMPLGQAARHFARHIAAVVRHVRRRLDRRSGAAAGQSIYYIGGLEPDFQRVRDASIVAWERYRPRPVAGRVVLFKSVQGDPHACDPLGIWRRLVAELETVVVPGSHVTMIRKPLAQTLAAAISVRLGVPGACGSVLRKEPERA